MDNTFQFPNVLSFCPGILGLERGLIRAIGKINVVAYVEREAFIIANLIAGMQAGVLDARPVWTDAKTFHTVAKSFRNKIHILLGGYPCQPFSLSGQRKGAEDPRHLWPSLSRTIEAVGPVCCFFENVSGHLSMGFDEVYRDLRRLGYAVEAGIFTAEEVGAPHERERLFILAISDNFKWRLAEWQPRQKWESSIKDVDISRAGEELADTNSESGQSPTTIGLDLERNTLFEAGRNESADGSESFSKTELEHAAGRRCEQCNPGVGTYVHLPSEGCQCMANTKGSGIQRDGTEREQITSLPIGKKIPGCDSRRIQQWPAGREDEQYEWEEPRTIKPRMGSTINGYNFREDLLRALGNSVVEQTAEIAFLNLLQKHLKNLK